MSTPGKRNLLAAKRRHLLVVEPRADGQAGEVVTFLQQLAEALAVLGRDLDHRGQLVDQRLQVAGFGGRDLERIGGVVVRQHGAVAIQDQPAVGDDGDDGDAVVLGQRMVVVVLQSPAGRRTAAAAGRKTPAPAPAQTASRTWKLCSSFWWSRSSARRAPASTIGSRSLRAANRRNSFMRPPV